MPGQFWEDDPLVSEAPQPQSGPRPVFTVPDPRAAQDDARKAADLELRRAEAERAEAKFIQDQEDRRLRKDATGGVDTTEAEKTAAFLATRLAASIRTLGEIGGGDKPGVVAEGVRKVFGDTAANLINNEDRQRVEAAQADLVDAALTLGTGAAYTAEQKEGYRKSYFPQIGDTEATVADKRKRLDVLLEAARIKAGAAGTAIDQALGKVPTANSPEMVGGVPKGSEIEFGMDAPPQGAFDRNAWLKKMGLDPDEEAEIVGFWNANRGNKEFTVGAAKKWFQDRGYDLPGEADINLAVRDARRGMTFTAMDSAGAKAAYEAKLDAEMQRRRTMQGDGAPGMMDLATQGASGGLGDEAAGIGGAIAGAFGADTGYDFERDLRRRELEQARERTGWTGTAVELLGNAAGMGATAATALPASARATTGEAALAGAVPGFGYGEGAGESAAGAVTGATIGAGLGRLFYGIGAGKGPKPPTDGGKVIQAADRLNARFGTKIEPIPADVGGPGIRRATGGAAQMPFGAGPIIRGGKAVTDQSQSAAEKIAATAGKPQELEAAGEAALGGARKWIKSSKVKVDALYAKARKLGGDVTTPLNKAVATLDGHIAELEKTPGGAKGLDDLKGLRAEIEGDWTVDGIKRMRTQLRDRFLDNGLRGSDLERRVGQVVDAAEQDIADGLAAAGKAEAAKAYSEAAGAYRERVQLIDNVLAPIVGKKSDAAKSGEQIMAAINAATKQNNARLGEFMEALPAEDAATVRATIIAQLGRASDGTNNAEGTAFSLAQFLTRWNAISDPAKRTLFGGELRASLDDLAKVAEGSKEAGRFANSSNTGSVLWLTLTAAGGGASALSGDPTWAVLGFLAQRGGGRALASPAFARWLGRVPKTTTPGAVRSHVAGLSKVAAADSAIAADALGLQRQLMAAFESGPQRLAANPDSPNEGAETATTGSGTR